MKRLLLLLFSLVFIFGSCHKRNSALSGNDECTNFKTLHYKKYVPDTLMADSADIDFNNDSIMDIKIITDRWIEWFGPHPHDCYSITMNAYDNVKFLIKHPYCGVGCARTSDSTEYININNPVSNDLLLVLEHLGWGCKCITDTSYIGFYLIKNSEKYFGWIKIWLPENAIFLSEYAILESSCDSIRFGVH
jgi:hypothetical protein